MVTRPASSQSATAPLGPAPGDAATRDPGAVGGKAAALARLVAAGVDVPDFAVVGVDAFTAALEHPSVDEARARAAELVAAGDHAGAAAAMQAAVRELQLDDELVRSLHDLRGRIDAPLVAVRSSALGEDGVEHSFAGQFESVLGVATDEQLVDALRTCWASAWTERAVGYRARHGLDPLEVGMAVVVQAQVDADVAGVCFTGDPVSGDPYTLVASATWGLGEALVSGEADADTYRFDRRHDLVEVDLADKDRMVRLAPDGLVERVDVPADLRGRRTLSDAQVRELAQACIRIEQAEGTPQDIEFALAGKRLLILQARPITTALRPRGVRRTWDNSNIVESYSGVVSTLTFSFAREAYASVYLQALRLLRLPDAEMDRARVVVRQMLGHVDGRVYYNLASWYYLLSVLPDYERNAAAMEQMMGVRAPLDRRVAPPASARRKVRLYAAMAWQLLRIRRSIREFREHVHGVLRRWRVDVSQLDADELVEAYDQMRLELLGAWRVPIVNDTRVMMAFDRLKSTIDQLGIDDPDGTLRNDLMCGQGDVESAMPTHLLLRAAEVARREPALASAILTADVADVRRVVRAAAAGELAGTGEGVRRAATELDAMLDEYMERYGDRCADELKLETPTLHEDPTYLHRLLQTYVRRDDLTEAGMLERERAVRDAAEARVAEALAASGTVLTRPLRRWYFRRMLAWARNAVRDREALRLDRTRVFGLGRRLLLGIGARLHEAGLLDDPRDAIHLEVDELIGTVQGTCTTGDLRGLVAVRRAELERRLQDELPDRIDTIGPPAANPLEPSHPPVDLDGSSLQGIGCCAGEVVRPARVVHDPAQTDDLAGDIMACTRTDPGWVPLFPSCGGLLVERGSLLSHSAIVAREFGIPAIVGIPGLLQWVEDGEELRMDGSSGVVERPAAADEDADEPGRDGEAGA